MEKIAVKRNIVYVSFFILCCLCFGKFDASAHSPHDVIDSLVVSPEYSKDQTVFINIKNTWILKSINGGYSWKYLHNGIDNKYKLISMSISPSFALDQTLFITSKGDGVFRSVNGGASWERVNNGLDNLRINLISLSPNFLVDHTACATGSDGGLYMTGNGGEKWEQILGNSFKISAIAMGIHKDAEELSIIVGDKQGILYLYDETGKFKELYRVKNSGAITCIVFHTSKRLNETLFVGTETGGFYKSFDSGSTFVESNKGIKDKYITSISLSPVAENRSEIFVSTWNNAVYRSVDNGKTWVMNSEGLTKDRQANSEEYRSPHFRNIVISSDFKKDRTILLAGFDGLFKSEDGGENWIQLETMPVKLIKGFAISPSKNKNFSIAITTYGGGAYISEDDGNHWSVNNLGLRKTRLSDVVFSPTYQDDKRLFTASEKYFYIYEDHNKKWEGIRLRDKKFTSRVYSVLVRLGISRDWLEKNIFGKTNINTIWPNIISVSPNFNSDRTLFFGSRYRGFFKSVNGGNEFFQIWSGIDEMHKKKITSICISPNFVSDQTIFGSIRWEGIFKSKNGGRTWLKQNNGIRILKDADALIPPYYFLAISPNYQSDQTVFVGTENGLFKTENGGSIWRSLKITNLGNEVNVKCIAISPNYNNDNTLIISLNGKGLFKSTNNGTTWHEIGKELKSSNYLLEFLIFSDSYQNDNTIWGASREAVFKSTDMGNNWFRIHIPIVRYENNRDVVTYDGTWQYLKGDEYSAGSIDYSESLNAKAQLSFVGTGVRWIGTKSDKHGVAQVYIDGEFKAFADQFSKIKKIATTIFEISNLNYGPHIIAITPNNNESFKSKTRLIDLDAFDVLN